MKNEKLIFIVSGILILIVIFIINSERLGVSEEARRELLNIQNQGLGNLCSNEEECNEFCTNNLGHCEEYCKNNPSNILCKEWSSEREIRETQRDFQQFREPESSSPSCGDKKELFTVSHIPVSKLQNIIPLGNLNPPGHTFPTNHIYFHLKGFTGDESVANAPVIAPGDMWITRIGSSEYIMRGRQIKDYKLDFIVCKEVKGYFIHLTSLSEKLLRSFSSDNCEEYDTGGTHYKNCEKDFYSSPIFLSSGESIGTVGGSSDFGLSDLRIQELVYANPGRWYDEPLHRVCPLDYFVPNLKSELYALLGDGSSKRTFYPVCGEVAQDNPGTAQGVWFVKGTRNTYPEDPHVSLVHDNINPLKGVFSVGTSMSNSGLQTGIYYFTPKSSGLINRDFKDVTADGNVYCYDSLTQRFGEQISRRIILQLTAPATLRIQAQLNSCGNGPWSFDNALEFER